MKNGETQGFSQVTALVNTLKMNRLGETIIDNISNPVRMGHPKKHHQDQFTRMNQITSDTHTLKSPLYDWHVSQQALMSPGDQCSRRR